MCRESDTLINQNIEELVLKQVVKDGGGKVGKWV